MHRLMNAEYPVFPDDVFKGSMIWAALKLAESIVARVPEQAYRRIPKIINNDSAVGRACLLLLVLINLPAILITVMCRSIDVRGIGDSSSYALWADILTGLLTTAHLRLGHYVIGRLEEIQFFAMAMPMWFVNAFAVTFTFFFSIYADREGEVGTLILFLHIGLGILYWQWVTSALAIFGHCWITS